jgi:transposase
MGTDAIHTCPNCQRLQAQRDDLHAHVETLKATLAHLQSQLAAARKDSSTSSKPPSSDIVKPPKPPPPPGQDRRKIGGQPGHPKHERALVPPALVTGGTHDHFVELCPACGHGLQPTAAAPHVVQQIEIPTLPLVIEEHCSHPGWCPHCQAVRHAPFPVTIERGGLVGPRLTTLIAYLKGACHASFSTIRKFLRDVVQVTISRGQLAKIIGKVSQALEQPDEELLKDLPTAARLNLDETGHKQNGVRMWTWLPFT